MNKKRRSTFKIIAGLSVFVKPMLLYIVPAVIMGCIGNLMASFITILGGMGILSVSGLAYADSLRTIIILMAIFAVLRGFLRYAEQACNHYIAFKLLADIRHRVFASLRKLAPAKLDGEDKGALISIITTDIELLEVFYAHTISPVLIALITTIVMVVFLGRIHVVLALTALCMYLIAGVLIPFINGHMGSNKGKKYRNEMRELGTLVLDNLYGLDEILQYGQQKVRKEKMTDSTKKLYYQAGKLKNAESIQTICTNMTVITSGVIMFAVAAILSSNGQIASYNVVIGVITIMSSFGPLTALSSLSNDLNQTLASANRVLDLLDEEPAVAEICNGTSTTGDGITVDKVTFAYPDANNEYKEILSNCSVEFKDNGIHGIVGKSGCGKSTLLKLIMRFYVPDKGRILSGNSDIETINTEALRSNISYVEQETFLFNDTIENNLKIAKMDATHDEIELAARKASIHDFVMSLPEGYQTRLEGLTNSLSGGERQRIGLARAFLHSGKVILLDEPTSNIDSLNEGIILRCLEAEKKDRTIVLVSHRTSTMNVADSVLQM